MRILESMKARAKSLKHEIAALYYAYGDPETPRLPKLLILFTLGYALSPIDLIPDFIPVLGYLDDLVILPALIAWSLALIPQATMERARARASAEPIRLGKNRLFAAVFILVWAAIILALARAFVRAFGER